jgi:peptidyl-prolyl cis-trans isomerase SurA
MSRSSSLLGFLVVAVAALVFFAARPWQNREGSPQSAEEPPATGAGEPPGGSAVLDGIAAVVDDTKITFAQVRELVAAKEIAVKQTYRGEELVNQVKEIRAAAINELVDRQVILTEFKRRNLQIPDTFIDERINTIVREEFSGDDAALVRTLAAQGSTLERFRQLEKDRIIVVEMRRTAIKGNVNVTSEQIAAYYKENQEEYASPEQLKLRSITIRRNDGSNPRRQMIDEIRQKIVGGDEFGSLARMYSIDDKQEAFGDWGWIDNRTLNESLTQAAFSLKAGEMSPVIELGESYCLLFVEARKPATVKPLEEVRDEIEKTLIQAETQKMQAEWIAKLRRNSSIEVF